MKRSDMRVSQPRWCTLGSAAVAVAAVAVIGFTTVTPARAYADDRRAHHEWREHRDREEWREHREWREDRPPQDIYFKFGKPQPYYDNDRY
jgi:hypothetical protein